MFWILLGKEMLEQLLSVRFSVSLLLAFFFLIPATYMLATDYGEYSRGMQPVMKEEFFVSGRWYRLNRANPTLRVLATGLDQELSLSASSTASRGPAFENVKFLHNPLRYLFSQLDFVFFINVVGSLLAFAFTYNPSDKDGTIKGSAASRTCTARRWTHESDSVLHIFPPRGITHWR